MTDYITPKQVNEKIDQEVERLCNLHIAAAKPTRLFRYTDEEELRIARAKRSAEKFMAKFGLAPHRPQIDISHYANYIKTKWYD